MSTLRLGNVERMRCSGCGNEATFTMEVPVVLDIAPEGGYLAAVLDTTNPELMWDGGSWVQCSMCGEAASDRDFIEIYQDHLAAQDDED